MTFELASRVRSMPPSATLAITQRAAELKAAGQDVIWANVVGWGGRDARGPREVVWR